jgi:uncharacterized protein with HEPN domain
MSDRPDDLLVADIWESLGSIREYVEGITEDGFAADNKTVDAVVRNLEIVGEAANRLSDDFKRAHAEIEWKKIVGLRHRIVHEYFGVDVAIIWRIVQHDLPRLRELLAPIRRSLRN